MAFQAGVRYAILPVYGLRCEMRKQERKFCADRVIMACQRPIRRLETFDLGSIGADDLMGNAHQEDMGG
jgi:hypothetical protein